MVMNYELSSDMFQFGKNTELYNCIQAFYKNPPKCKKDYKKCPVKAADFIIMQHRNLYAVMDKPFFDNYEWKL